MTDVHLMDVTYTLPNGTVLGNLEAAGVYVASDGTVSPLAVATNVLEPIGADVTKAQADLYTPPDLDIRMFNTIYAVMFDLAKNKGTTSKVWDFTKRTELKHITTPVSAADKARIEAQLVTTSGYTVAWGVGDTQMTVTAP